MIHFMVSSMDDVYCEPEQRLVEHGQRNDTLYYLIKGSVKVQGWAFKRRKKVVHFGNSSNVNIELDESASLAKEVDVNLIKDSNKPQKYKIRELHPGSYFGEVSILFDSLASATVKTLNYGLIGGIPKDKMLDLFNRHPLYESEMKKTVIRSYHDDLRCFILTALRRIEFLSSEENASEDMLYELAFCFESITFK
jgi:CRP-like cAMP-binding protein